MKTPIRIQQLVAKELRGKISMSEKAELDEWYLKKGTDNSFKSPSKINTKRAFQSTIKQIGSPEKNQYSLAWRYLAAASVAAILIIVFWKSAPMGPDYLAETPADKYETVHNTFGTRRVLKLADGSRIWMRGDTELTIPKRFSENREIKLKGEAFFEVQKDSIHPFVVISTHAVTEVMGTSFLINTREKLQNVAVKSGQVKVTPSYGTTPYGAATTLNALEQLRWKPGEDLGKIEGVDPNRAFAWVDGKLIFSNTPILEVLEELKEWYGLEEVVKNNINLSCMVTGTYSRLTLKEVMESIKYATGINYEIYGKKLKVSKGNC